MGSKETKMHKCVMENKAKAKVGDTIVVTNKEYWHVHDKECIVVDCDTCPIMADDISEIVWATVNKKNHGGAFWVYHDDYKITQRANPVHSASCPDCKGTGEIELFTSTVKCRSCGRTEKVG